MKKSMTKTASKRKAKAKPAPLMFNLAIGQEGSYSLNVSISNGKIASAFSGDTAALNAMVRSIHRTGSMVAQILRQVVPQMQAPAPVPNWDETAKAWNALTPEQQAAAKADAPKGMQAVVESLNAVQTKRFGTVFEYQQLVEYMLQEMSDEFRAAMIKGDGGSVIALLSKAMDGSPHREQLADWFAKPEVATWIGEYTAQLTPSVEAWVAAHPPTAPAGQPETKPTRKSRSKKAGA